MSVIDGEVKLPALGGVNKKVLIGVGVAGAGYIGYRYYQNYKANQDATATADTPGFDDTSQTLPVVDGGSDISGTSNGETDTTVDGTEPTTNAAWTQEAEMYLEESGYDAQSVSEALGKYITSQPLTSAEQSIVSSAIAVAGYPPVGNISIIPGGDATLTTAPTGVKVLGTTDTTVTVQFSQVPGAAYYRGYRNGVGTNVSSNTVSPMLFAGLEPNTSYTFKIAAVTSGNAVGPQSAGVTAKTGTVTLKAPTGLKAGTVTSSSIAVTCSTVSGAEYYRWYVNGISRGASDNPAYTIGGLHSGTKYSITVAADTTTNTPGPKSGALTVTTKK